MTTPLFACRSVFTMWLEMMTIQEGWDGKNHEKVVQPRWCEIAVFICVSSFVSSKFGETRWYIVTSLGSQNFRAVRISLSLFPTPEFVPTFLASLGFPHITTVEVAFGWLGDRVEKTDSYWLIRKLSPFCTFDSPVWRLERCSYSRKYIARIFFWRLILLSKGPIASWVIKTSTLGRV